MKKTIWIIMIAFGGTIFAQPLQNVEGQKLNKGDKIETLRIAFISQQLDLTPQEAQKFWPVYNQYRNDLDVMRKNFKQSPEVKLTAEQQLDFEQKKLDLKKKYVSQFEAILGKEKLNRFYNLENEFRQKLKEMRDHRQQNGEHSRGNANSNRK